MPYQKAKRRCYPRCSTISAASVYTRKSGRDKYPAGIMEIETNGWVGPLSDGRGKYSMVMKRRITMILRATWWKIHDTEAAMQICCRQLDFHTYGIELFNIQLQWVDCLACYCNLLWLAIAHSTYSPFETRVVSADHQHPSNITYSLFTANCVISMADTESLESITSMLHGKRKAREPKSCLPCRQRKVKCDNRIPCKRCVDRDHPELCIAQSHSKRVATLSTHNAQIIA
jgi:hypothetical protein